MQRKSVLLDLSFPKQFVPITYHANRNCKPLVYSYDDTSKHNNSQPSILDSKPITSYGKVSQSKIKRDEMMKQMPKAVKDQINRLSVEWRDKLSRNEIIASAQK
jgi:hypothetical protein